jgi:hypothetical protein
MATTPKRKVPVVEKKAFSLDKYKKDKGLDKDVKFKIQEYIPTSKAFFDTTGVNIPISSLTCLFGHTNSGKTTLLFETAIACQKMGIIPVFVITELKFSFEHLKLMGFQMDEIVDENTGEITYDGNFIYLDRSSFETIEEMGEKVMEIMSDQSKGLLKDEHGKHLNICFLLDSIGTISSNLSRDSNKSNNEWDAGSISRVFGKGIIPRIGLTRKENIPYTTTMVLITQVWVRKPVVYGAQPKLACKGGDTIPFNSSICVQFGNVSDSGTSILKVKKNNKEVSYATRTKVSITKNHINGISTSGKIIATPHGFLMDSEGDKLAKAYFKDNAEYFFSLIGENSDITDAEFTEEDSSEGGDFQQ